MAVTLIDAMRMAGDRGETARAAVIELYARSSDILRVLPFENIEGSAVRYNQEEALPGIGFRGINEGYTESTGIINPQMEPLVIAGGDLDVDKFIVDRMGPDQRTSQEAMKVKVLAQRWSQAFIKGDSTGSSKEFDGLQTRIAGSQLITAGATAGGAALPLTKLDELIDAVDEPMALFMTKAMRRRLTQASRDTTVGGYISYTQDEFGRQVTMYNDLPILIADPAGSVYTTLGFNEACSGGGANTGTSIYCLSWGDGKMSGIQGSDPMVTDIGELETKPTLRTRVEWYNGIVIYHPRSIARLYSIGDLAVVK